jgi:hypothetical protein
MKKLFSLSLALLLSASCSSVVIPLQTKEFPVTNAAKLNVLFFKTKSKGFDLALNGSSATGKSVVIRKDEITCGRGETIGVVRGIGKVSDQYIMLPAESFKEFHVYCGNKEILAATGDYFVKFKNVYDSNNAGQPDKVIASDVMLVLK